MLIGTGCTIFGVPFWGAFLGQKMNFSVLFFVISRNDIRCVELLFYCGQSDK